MTLTGTVVDKVTGEPLAGATLSLDGSAFTTTDNRGMYAIPSTLPGMAITFSYVGYDDVTYPVDQISSLSQIPMNVSAVASALAPVVVTPSSSQLAVSAKPNTMFPLLLAGGGLLLLAGSQKRKRVSGGVNTTTLLLAGGAAVAVYLLTRPKTPTYVSPYQTPVYNPAYLQSVANPPNQTAQDISAGGTALTSILNAISNF